MPDGTMGGGSALGMLTSGGFGGAGGFAGRTDLVYLGRRQTTFDPRAGEGEALKAGGANPSYDHVVSADEAMLVPYTWDEQERDSFAQQMFQRGLISDPNSWEQLLKVWQAAVGEAQNFKAAGKNVTPWDALDLFPGAAAAGGPRTNKTTSTNLPSQSDIENAVTSMFQEQLGRDPTPNEIARYGSMLTAKAKANPSVTTTTQTTDAAGNSTSNVVSTGGVDLGAYGKQLVSDDPEHGAYQAVTTYMDVVQQMLGAAA